MWYFVGGSRSDYQPAFPARLDEEAGFSRTAHAEAWLREHSLTTLHAPGISDRTARAQQSQRRGVDRDSGNGRDFSHGVFHVYPSILFPEAALRSSSGGRNTAETAANSGLSPSASKGHSAVPALSVT